MELPVERLTCFKESLSKWNENFVFEKTVGDQNTIVVLGDSGAGEFSLYALKKKENQQ